MPENFKKITTGHRPARGLMYLALALAGASTFFIDLPFLQSLYETTLAGLGAFLLVGGSISGVGHFLKILVLERAGFPLVLAAVLGVAVMLFIGAGESIVRLFFGLFSLAFFLGLFARWKDLGTAVQIERAFRREAGSRG